MLSEVIFFQFGGFSGGSFGSLLAQWEALGVFSYVLPFLLIFALIFGILTRVDIFKGNKAVNGIIALTVSLLSLQFNFVPLFFSNIFPMLGIGLSVILAGLILMGLFTDPTKTWLPFWLGVVVFLVVIGSSFNFGSSPWWFFVQQNFATIVLVIIVLAVVFGLPSFGKNSDSIYGRDIVRATSGH